MLYGMGTVVIFLALLVLATTSMSGLISRYFPQPEPPPVTTRERSAGKARADGLGHFGNGDGAREFALGTVGEGDVQHKGVQKTKNAAWAAL